LILEHVFCLFEDVAELDHGPMRARRRRTNDVIPFLVPERFPVSEEVRARWTAKSDARDAWKGAMVVPGLVGLVPALLACAAGREPIPTTAETPELEQELHGTVLMSAALQDTPSPEPTRLHPSKVNANTRVLFTSTTHRRKLTLAEPQSACRATP
jgi:hypothetical protein